VVAPEILSIPRPFPAAWDSGPWEPRMFATLSFPSFSLPQQFHLPDPRKCCRRPRANLAVLARNYSPQRNGGCPWIPFRIRWRHRPLPHSQQQVPAPHRPRQILPGRPKLSHESRPSHARRRYFRGIRLRRRAIHLRPHAVHRQAAARKRESPPISLRPKFSGYLKLVSGQPEMGMSFCHPPLCWGAGRATTASHYTIGRLIVSFGCKPPRQSPASHFRYTLAA
jgi:hypothetical protein